jgi:hypothetical protein
MRNALAGALYELKELHGIAENGTVFTHTKEQLNEIMKAIVFLQDRGAVTREFITDNIIAHIKKLVDTQKEVEDIFHNVRIDVERGLGITNQIRDYPNGKSSVIKIVSALR